MNIDDQVPKSEVYTANGTTKEFTYPFNAPDTTTVRVEVNGTAATSGYTVTSASTESGIVKFDTAPVAGTKIFIYRVTPISLDMDLNDGASFHADVLNSAFAKMTMIAQELRGGTVSTIPFVESAATAGSATNAGSAATAGYAATAGGLRAGVVVASATDATNATNATNAANATNATNATTASGLANAARQSIIDEAVSSAGGSGGAFVYDGPFALKIDGSGGDMTAGMNSGYVWAGGSQYLISGFDNDFVAFGEGDTLYLTMLSFGGAISSGLVTSPSGTPEGTVVVRIASRELDTDETEQLQFGDIVTVPWGLGGGAGGLAVSACSLNTNHGYGIDSLCGGFVVATIRETTGSIAGQSAWIKVGDESARVFAIVGQGGGVDSATSYVCYIPPTKTWSANTQINAASAELYFFK